jgi:hypothetical protein
MQMQKIKICLECGKEFDVVTVRSREEICSSLCRKTRHKRRIKEFVEKMKLLEVEYKNKKRV